MMSLIVIIFYFSIIFISIVLHEYAHGWVAYRCGDPTAKLAGRLSLNPLKHIDLVGTVILPLGLLLLRFFGIPTILFGWAKPVPVNFRRLRNPKRDMMFVGVSGPLMNMFIAISLSQCARMPLNELVLELVGFAVFINLLLGIFNMIPIPPLDGSRLLMGLLPDQMAIAYARLERRGMLFVFLLMYCLMRFDVFERWLLPFIETIMKMLGVNF